MAVAFIRKIGACKAASDKWVNPSNCLVAFSFLFVMGKFSSQAKANSTKIERWGVFLSF